jgi:hypothetical protein
LVATNVIGARKIPSASTFFAQSAMPRQNLYLAFQGEPARDQFQPIGTVSKTTSGAAKGRPISVRKGDAI